LRKEIRPAKKYPPAHHLGKTSPLPCKKIGVSLRNAQKNGVPFLKSPFHLGGNLTRRLSTRACFARGKRTLELEQPVERKKEASRRRWRNRSREKLFHLHQPTPPRGWPRERGEKGKGRRADEERGIGLGNALFQVREDIRPNGFTKKKSRGTRGRKKPAEREKGPPSRSRRRTPSSAERKVRKRPTQKVKRKRHLKYHYKGVGVRMHGE